SALFLIPLRPFIDTSHTMPYLLVLRQLSPLFLVTAIVLLCHLQTGFESPLAAVVLFVFLSLIPAVFDMSMWWHPDALALLFVVLTIFALNRDQLRFGRWFYVAAAFCGLATGTKLLGVWFFFAVAVYLGLGFTSLGVRGVMRHAVGFVAVMLLAIAISNPLILWPRFARQIVAGHMSAISQLRSGRDVRKPLGIVAWYPALRDGFGGWWIYAFVIAACLGGLFASSGKRLLNIIIVAWCIPLALWLFFAADYKPERYFLPVLIPLFSCVGQLISRRGLAITVASVVAITAQTAMYARTDTGKYWDMTHREVQSPSLNFYRRLDHVYLSHMPSNLRVRVFRDPYVYFPSWKNVDAHYVWRAARYSDIRPLEPDLIVLQQDYIGTYADPATEAVAVDADEARASRPLYEDARHDRIPGYRKILETPFAIAFARAVNE
ncbi:MAG TPA: hypothetical protein VG871_17440, partial [Vicinamibacterales bacterium]|nr:hypothetical protein [Vicinamibacterales bacterium]